MFPDRFRDSPSGRLVEITGHDPRFGRDYRHWAFEPNPLPDEVPLTLATWSAVAGASLALGRLDQAGRQIPNPDLLRRPTLRREAQSTSALEGTFAPLADVLEADLDGEPNTPEVIEVLNYVAAAEYAFDWIGARPFSLNLLLDLHRLLMQNTKSETPDLGRLRSTQVFIGGSGGPIEKSRFVPVPPGDALEAGIRSWLDWMNSSRDMPVVARTALAHYQFEALHPFNDGNGRIGRLLIVAQLLHEGVLRDPLLTVSPWFEARRQEYQDQLLRLSETGDYDRWVAFFAEALRAQAEATTSKIDALLAFADRARESVRAASPRAGLALELAGMLIEHPVVSPAWLQRSSGRSWPAADSAIARLVELGLLIETTGGRYARVFVAREVLNILEG